MRRRGGTDAASGRGLRPPDGRDAVGVRQRALDFPLRQEHVEVSVLHVLRHHAQRVGRHAHAQQPDDVRVVQPRHDLDFLQEVVSDGRKDRDAFESQRWSGC